MIGETTAVLTSAWFLADEMHGAIQWAFDANRS